VCAARLLAANDARDMAQWRHGGGFSVAASVRIWTDDRAGRERLLRYARPSSEPCGLIAGERCFPDVHAMRA
jgi:hypothetical protein